jgi:large subunit ribosomal protein L28
MSRKCDITGKRPLRASAISHAHNVTPRFQKPNVQNKRIYVPELKRWVRLKVSTRALRSINRVGLLSYLRAEGKTLADVT